MKLIDKLMNERIEYAGQIMTRAEMYKQLLIEEGDVRNAFSRALNAPPVEDTDKSEKPIVRITYDYGSGHSESSLKENRWRSIEIEYADGTIERREV